MEVLNEQTFKYIKVRNSKDKDVNITFNYNNGLILIFYTCSLA